VDLVGEDGSVDALVLANGTNNGPCRHVIIDRLDGAQRREARGKVLVDACNARGVIIIIRVGVGFRIRPHGGRKTICCTTRTVHGGRVRRTVEWRRSAGPFVNEA